MRTTEPKIERRPALSYVGIRERVAIRDFPAMIQRSIGRAFERLGREGGEPAGPPLIRYHACPTAPKAEASVDVCVGLPLARPFEAGPGFEAGTLPAGEYAALVYTGADNGVAGNAALIDWVRAQGRAFDCWPVDGGEGFAGRVEHLIDGPEDDPDPANWRTEVAIMLA